jgi:predicted O-methyltransferase YrrM
MATDPRWTAVDSYFVDHLLTPDADLEQALTDSADGGLPSISVTALQGKFLQLLARSSGAQRILEIGTLGGYSTIWLARALSAGGNLVTLEISTKHADVARANIARAGLTDRVEVIVGPARDTLRQLADEHAAPFDFIFIDADKESSAPYFTAALALSRSGTLIVVDNVVRDGEVADAASSHRGVVGVRELIAQLQHERRVEATALQMVGAKGYDGMLLAIVN